MSLSSLGRPWAGLDLEVSDPEIDRGLPHPEPLAPELLDIAATLGFVGLRPVGLVPLEYQIAQKIHAVTAPAYQCAHDLVMRGSSTPAIHGRVGRDDRSVTTARAILTVPTIQPVHSRTAVPVVREVPHAVR